MGQFVWGRFAVFIFLFPFDVSESSCSFKTRKMVMLVHRRHNNTDPLPPTAVLQILRVEHAACYLNEL